MLDLKTTSTTNLYTHSGPYALYVLSRFVMHPIVWSLRHKGNYIKNRPASHLEKQTCRVDINLQVLNVNVNARRQ